MPTLIVNLAGQARGLVLGDRALIGRRPFNTIALPDPTVSRIHAWIGRRDGRYVLFDAGSRAGTRVNGRPVTAPRALVDGDAIGVGPVVVEYRDADDLPTDVEPIGVSPPSPVADPYDGGIYFDCACGGPMWVGAELAGATGKCRYCGKRLVVPHVSGQTARSTSPSGELPNTAPRRPPPHPAAPAAPARGPEPAATPAIDVPPPAPAPPPPLSLPPPQQPVAVASPAAAPMPEPGPAESELAVCSICQTGIAARDEKATCPSCGSEFHAGCWRENHGCGAYGCDQVNVLAPPETRTPAQEQPLAGEVSYDVPDPTLLDDAPAFPWESVLLALSFVAMFLSALGFGVPSAAMGVAALVMLVVGRGLRKSLVVVALLVSAVGTIAGYGMSMFWWRGERVWEPWVQRVSEAVVR